MPASAATKRIDSRPHGARRSIYARSLHTACTILGGVPHLADRLGVPSLMVREWLEGRGEPPQPVFLAAVEVILRHVEARSRES